MSLSPENRCRLSGLVTSMSMSDFGRPIRSSRSSAWLFRLEIADSTQNVPATMAPNTKIGASSSAEKNANSSTGAPRCVS